MMTKLELAQWTARAAFSLYAASVSARLSGREALHRVTWIAGSLVFVLHVAAAFHFHEWSHAAAFEATAKQTAELMGVRSGSGLYLNYLFTAVWTLDALWLLTNPGSYRMRSRPVAAAVHGFMAFMFFNAAVVFASGWSRWFGVAVTCILAVQSVRLRRRIS